MKVAYLINCYPQASHSFIRREIAALEAMGVEIVRISIRRPTAIVDPADRAELEKTFIVFNHLILASWLAFTWMIRHPGKSFQAFAALVKIARNSGGWIKQWLYLVEGLAIASWLKRWGISHVHAHFGTNSAAVAMYNQLAGGASYSFTAHGPEEFDAPEKLGIQEKVRHALYVVAISEFGRSQLFRWSTMEDWGKIHVVHCGLDKDFLHAQRSDITEKPRLVCVGRLSEQKGQLVLLRAFAEVVKEREDAELILVGDGPMRGDIENLIAELAITDHVTITGWQSNAQVRQHILSGRAMVLPSFAEGLPVVIMESLALQRPVISTYVAGIPELVEPGVNGWLVPAGSIDDLAACLLRVLNEAPDKLVEMGKAGARRVAEAHDANIEARKLAALFSEHISTDESRIPVTSTKVEAV